MASLSLSLTSAALSQVWPAQELARADGAVLSTGYADLDRQLPGGGWPIGAMVELLQAHEYLHVWQLLLPGLVQAASCQVGPVVLVGAPGEPFCPGLRARGLPGERLLWVRADQAAARLWAAEQALRCAQVAAVLAWLPQARSAELRRLQLAAQQQGRLLFVLRGASSRNEASPARLRLLLEGDAALNVHILKRRGPPLDAAVTLPAHAPRLAALLATWGAAASLQQARPGPARTARPGPRVAPLCEGFHALDRPVAA
ncbi:MAG TPA: translesion DNA synthesis-associated protein ImuA [Rhodoferax sp.]|nr:translesion DNA synthesis-associated protein ImuA [Rhodoferax sp.]